MANEQEGGSGQAEVQNSGSSWIQKIMDILNSGVSAVGNATGMNPVALATLPFIAKYIDQQQNKSGMGTSEALGYANNAAQYYTDRMKEAAVPTTVKDSALAAVQNRAANNPLTPMTGANLPTLQNAPRTFNPYASGQMGNGVDAGMLATMERIANGGMNPTTSGINNLLGTQIGQRFGARDMRSGNVSGQLTPQSVTGTTNPYGNMRPAATGTGTSVPATQNMLSQYNATGNPNMLFQLLATLKNRGA